jgi:hypothetical protein
VKWDCLEYLLVRMFWELRPILLGLHLELGQRIISHVEKEVKDVMLNFTVTQDSLKECDKFL